jgi:hypothetical protein
LAGVGRGARSSCGMGSERGGKYVGLVVWLEDGAPEKVVLQGGGAPGKVVLQRRWCSRERGLHLERSPPPPRVRK